VGTALLYIKCQMTYIVICVLDLNSIINYCIQKMVLSEDSLSARLTQPVSLSIIHDIAIKLINFTFNITVSYCNFSENIAFIIL